MRISTAVGGPDKLAAKAACAEAQRDKGRRQPVWVKAMMLATSVVVIMGILAGMAYFVNFPLICGNDDTVVEDAFLPEDIPERPARSSAAGIVPHSAWSLRPQGRLPQLLLPAPYVVVKHTAGPRCSGLRQCTPLLRAIQELHWQMYDQPEISYNFLIDSDGNIYEGRGWNSTNPSKGIALRCNVDVALIGNYVEQNVTEETSSALRWLLQEGVSRGALAADYRLLAHSQVKSTFSPGRGALTAIADWPHRCLQRCERGAVCRRPDDSHVGPSR